MATLCLACYSNWFRKRVDGFLWRCVFWSPIVLTVCVARQVEWREETTVMVINLYCTR